MSGFDSSTFVPSFLEILNNSTTDLPPEEPRRDVQKPAAVDQAKGDINSMKMAQMVLDETMQKLTRIGAFMEKNDETLHLRQLEESKKEILYLESENRKLKFDKDKAENELRKIQGKDPFDFSSRTTQELRELHDQFEVSREQIKKLLDERGRRLEDITLCVVCNEKDRSVLLQPCTHLALCGSCALQCETCPICRGLITNRVDVKVS